MCCFCICTSNTQATLFMYSNSLILKTIYYFVSFWAISNVVYLLAGYLRIRQTQPQSLFSKFSNPALMPTILSMIQILITRQSWVSFVYRNIYAPQSERILTLALVIVILYFLAAAFCHFSNIYCLLGFWFLIHGPETIQKRWTWCCNKKSTKKKNCAIRQKI